MPDHEPTASKLGLWIIGARGNVAVTVAAGLSAMKLQLAESIGLCTEQPGLSACRFRPFDQIVVGGHEIAEGSAQQVLHRLSAMDRIVDPRIADSLEDDVAAYDERIRPGFEASSSYPQLADDMRAFAEDNGIDRLVVVNLSSVEAGDALLPTRESELRSRLDQEALPMSCAYALAALDAGASYVNFTTSTGATGAVFDKLFAERGLVHAGRDGKTGETLLKSALLPMFAARNLRVQSWFGQNILGNGDGKTLRDPDCMRAKQESKGGIVAGILGYQPEARVGIDYVESLGDWKVAWDHVLFQGFLGTQMSLQLTWQGADSILAAPLVIDLARICDFACKRGDSGLLRQLGFFFKEPIGSQTHTLVYQYQELLQFLTGGRG